MLHYNAAYINWESNKKRSQLAFKLIMLSLCKAITIKVEEHSD